MEFSFADVLAKQALRQKIRLAKKLGFTDDEAYFTAELAKMEEMQNA